MHEPGGTGQPNIHQNTLFLALPTKGPSDEPQSGEIFGGALAAPAAARCPEPTVVPTPTPPQSAGMPKSSYIHPSTIFSTIGRADLRHLAGEWIWAALACRRCYRHRRPWEHGS